MSDIYERLIDKIESLSDILVNSRFTRELSSFTREFGCFTREFSSLLMS
ncbi:hypothetical protein ABIE66_004566 [Peribacillus sp. B2I2]